MIFRTVAGAVICAAALMIWGFLFWVVLIPPGTTLKRLPGEVGLVRELAEAVPESGSYYFPLPPLKDGTEQGPGVMESFRERHVSGPIGLLHYSRKGSDPFSMVTYLLGFAHFFLSALLAAILLMLALPALETFVGRAAFVFGLGLFATVAMRLGDPIWWKLPWEFHLTSALYHLISWLIAGLVLAAVVKPSVGYRHMTDPSKPLWKRALDVK